MSVLPESVQPILQTTPRTPRTPRTPPRADGSGQSPKQRTIGPPHRSQSVAAFTLRAGAAAPARSLDAAVCDFGTPRHLSTGFRHSPACAAEHAPGVGIKKDALLERGDVGRPCCAAAGEHRQEIAVLKQQLRRAREQALGSTRIIDRLKREAQCWRDRFISLSESEKQHSVEIHALGSKIAERAGSIQGCGWGARVGGG